MVLSSDLAAAERKKVEASWMLERFSLNGWMDGRLALSLFAVDGKTVPAS